MHTSLPSQLYRRFIRGQSQFRTARRYQLISNSLFCGSLLACLGGAIIATRNTIHRTDYTLIKIALLAATLIVLWWLSRSDRRGITTLVLLFSSVTALANVLLASRFGIPSVEIGIVLLITSVMTLLEVGLTRVELAAERDLLEQRVIERTQQLEETQLQRMLELQRFADFGRVSAHLLHEVANPLTVASLYLQQADVRSSVAIRQARRSLQQLERYVTAARKQLKSKSQTVDFNVYHELRQLLSILRPVAQHANVKVVIAQVEPVVMHGDAVRFNQMMANLISNAIDAYEGQPRTKRLVTITISRSSRYVQINVHDNGKGITPLQLPHIFEPFYSTKQDTTRGLGIGLAMVKQAVREQFHGTICANSSPHYGTTFTLLLKDTQQATVQPTAFGLLSSA